MPSRLKIQPLSRLELSFLSRFPFGICLMVSDVLYGAPPEGHAPGIWMRYDTQGPLFVGTPMFPQFG